MQTFYLTDTGKVREHNEDNVIIDFKITALFIENLFM